MKKIFFVLILLLSSQLASTQERLIYQNFEKVVLDSLPLELTEKVGLFLNPTDFNMKFKKLPGLSIFNNYIEDEISFLKDSIVTERGMVCTSYNYQGSKLMDKKTEANPGGTFGASYIYDENNNLIEEQSSGDRVVYTYEKGKILNYTTISARAEVKMEYLDELTEVRNTWKAGKDHSRDTIRYNEDGKIAEVRSSMYYFYTNIDNYKNSFNEKGNLVTQTFEQKSSLNEKVSYHYLGEETRNYNNFQWLISQTRQTNRKTDNTSFTSYDRTISYEAFRDKTGNYVLVKSTVDDAKDKQSIDIYVLDKKYNWIIHEIEEDGKHVMSEYRIIEYIEE